MVNKTQILSLSAHPCDLRKCEHNEPGNTEIVIECCAERGRGRRRWGEEGRRRWREDFFN